MTQGDREAIEALLAEVETPDRLRRLGPARLPEVAGAVRRYLIDTVSRTGGHLAAGLGVVELSVALHYVFDTPRDRLVWDVGHQAYPHKILTGRWRRMHSLRQKDGLSGFLKRDESGYDAFGAGHSSTSVSAALGMAVAARAQGIEREHIAVIGDGALSAGMAFEALNHAGSIDADLLVILNDNDMSISPPVGAISNYLARVLSSRFYNRMREGSKQVLDKVPGMKDLAHRWEEHMKGMFMPGTLFEELGFTYIGPIDGHDLPLLVSTLENMREMHGPRFLHVVTQKGRGFAPAEGDPCVYHGVTPFNPETGKMESRAGGRSFTSVFSDWICDLAAQDERVMAITPAMCEGSGLVAFAKRFPERYHDVGIAEQHAVTFAAGLACEGIKPVVAIYSTFLQRAYDQLVHDVALQNLDVTFAVDRAGEVGADGATHAGIFDLSFARCVPNMAVLAPADEAECRALLQTAWEHPGPALVRYPRGAGIGTEPAADLTTLRWGKGELRRRGQGIAILNFGTLIDRALALGEALDATVANMRFVKPLDEELVRELAQEHRFLVTLEENVVAGGVGSGVGEYLAAAGIDIPILHFGLPDRWIEQGTQAEQLADAGLTVEQMREAIRRHLPADISLIAG
ncbi:1-deoxy-D-xylulose-5-phosphate synthase [endosymbiont of unidentified scaly snail isolate Monju]|uniref:1-deoxy-D-xylulose-5-phosphate synthase n=1 Tax=endosymbiont of unidentified scaly snail isolate Monju TaxID=1248727 RepID=UPI00038921FC|nr:1-deoxy-D-xylulose-5-phosphate synthase [endosymbiont of unidentified scaly snail isolate Monju]BAN68380.1 1-deoxy-D-xylulose-5-phosphate synthase [endosymbiont of unidentified scaly snail isolate Monju]